MTNDLEAQIYENLKLQDTETLVEIWQNHDEEEWQEITFDIVKEILLSRLGYLPPLSVEVQIERIVKEVSQYLKLGEFENALDKCETAVLLAPERSEVYYLRGLTFDAMERPEDAMRDYQKAIQLDPENEEAWEDMLSLEKELEKDFLDSEVKESLDRTLSFAQEDEIEAALRELDQLEQSMPPLAIAWNYRGMLFEGLESLEPAIEAYLEAIRLNPRYWNARENLGNARYKLMEEMFRRQPEVFVDEETGYQITIPEVGDERLLGGLNIEESLPAWLYMNECSYVQQGCPGYRVRPGRSGYDPFDRAAEQGRIEGILIKKLFTGKLRTHNPIYLLVMLCAVFVGCLPLVGYFSTYHLNLWVFLGISIVFSPYIVGGLAILFNVLASLVTQSTPEDEMSGSAFF